MGMSLPTHANCSALKVNEFQRYQLSSQLTHVLQNNFWGRGIGLRDVCSRTG